MFNVKFIAFSKVCHSGYCFSVMHDFFTRFANTKIYVWKKPKGYGLRCHRVIRSICEMVGIKDLYAKTEGGDAIYNIVQAFLLGLLRQVRRFVVYKRYNCCKTTTR